MGGGPPGFKQGFSCPALLWMLLRGSRFRLPGFHRLRPAFPGRSATVCQSRLAVLNPAGACAPGLACSRFARRYYGNRCFFLLLPLLRCFSSRRFPPLWLCVRHAAAGLFPAGFPHSDIHGSSTVCVYPWLFAAFRVLHRLLAPRHPPFALYSLTVRPRARPAFMPSLLFFFAFSFQGSPCCPCPWAGPRAALVNAAPGPAHGMETRRIELLTPCLQGRCSPS